MNNIYIIGGAMVDIYASTFNKIIIKDSNPSKISFTYGGVGHNIAMNLNSLNKKVNFISAFGDDIYGIGLYNSMKEKGINLEHSKIVNGEATSIYIAMMEKEDMFVGVSDLSIIKHIDESVIDELEVIIDENDYVIFDTNLKEDIIEYLCKRLKGFKIVDAISANKVVKLMKVFDYIDVLKLNYLEAQTLSNNDLSNENDLYAFIKEINNKGVKELLISKSNCLFIGINNQIYKYSHNAYNDCPVNVSGAGDALLSAYAYGIMNNLDLESRSNIALVAGIITTEYDSPSRNINLNNLDERKENIDFNGGLIYEY